MFPKLKKKLLGFIADEKGTISKNKLIKGAIVLSGIGIAAKDIRASVPMRGGFCIGPNARCITPECKKDDFQGFHSSPHNINNIPTASMTGHMMGNYMNECSDGGTKYIPGQPIVLGDQQCWVHCDMGDFDEVKVTVCSAIPPFYGCLLTCMPTKTVKDIPCPFHVSGPVKHYSADRAWHTNENTLVHEKARMGFKAEHKNKQAHHQINNAACITHFSTCVPCPEGD